jgi:hypothetical protein
LARSGRVSVAFAIIGIAAAALFLAPEEQRTVFMLLAATMGIVALLAFGSRDQRRAALRDERLRNLVRASAQAAVRRTDVAIKELRDAQTTLRRQNSAAAETAMDLDKRLRAVDEQVAELAEWLAAMRLRDVQVRNSLREEVTGRAALHSDAKGPVR